MSYILDALKKVEQKRDQEISSRAVSFSTGPTAPAKERHIWPYVLIAVLALNAVLLLAWFVSDKPPGEISITAKKSQNELVRREHAISERDSRTEVTGKKHTAAIEVRKPPPPLPKSAVVLPPQELSHDSRTARRTVSEEGEGKDTTSTVPTGQTRKTSTAEPPATREIQKERVAISSGRTYALNDLPAEVRRALPDFKISGHAYGQEAPTRVVRINEKILQEGQDLAPGLRLEEIVPEGVIMSYNGLRFRVGLNQSR
jgi:general secretion pathway protein B